MSQAMSGNSDYDKHSAAQTRDALSQADLVMAAAGQVVPQPAKGAVVLVDYGSAQGGVSVALMKAAIEQVRRHAPDVPISVVHNDVLSNDWATLFEHIGRLDGYLAVPGGPITPLASAASFYQPVLPAGLVDVGLSFAAIQWLDDPVVDGTGTALYFDQLGPDDRAAMASAAHADWSRFLELRADELAPGGRLVLDMMGVGDDGVAAGHDSWQLVRTIAEELVEEKALDRSRLDAYVMPIYERTLDEARRPFDGEVGRRLELERLELHPSTHPAVARYRTTGDAEALAEEFVGFFRAFSAPTLRAGLGLSAEALTELYRRLRSRIAAHADGFDFTVHVITAVVARR